MRRAAYEKGPRDRFLPSSAPELELRGLDPVQDFERIVFLTHHQLFAVETSRGLQLALIKSFAAPSISGLLAHTGEFSARASKRAQDTALMMCEMSETGLASPRAQAVIARLNAIHGRFKITNDDFLFILSCFLLEPVDYIAAYGRRPLTPAEQDASLLHYQGVGAGMKIADIPSTLEGFRRFRADYESVHLRFAQSNVDVLNAALSYNRRFLPYGLGKAVLRALLASQLKDENYLAAFGLAARYRYLRHLVGGVLKTRGAVISLLPAPKRARYAQDYFGADYPDGFDPSQI